MDKLIKKVNYGNLYLLFSSKFSHRTHVVYLIEFNKKTLLTIELEVYQNLIQNNEALLIAHEHGRD